MHPFVHTALPGRTIFGSGTINRLADELRTLQCERALVLSTPLQAYQAGGLADRLGPLCVGTFTEAAMHTPVEITQRALRICEVLDADCVVALGGGSTTGLGKAVAFRTDLPLIAVPTTYAGSEATPILGETVDGRKMTCRTAQVLPKVILYDVDLTVGLPGPVSVTSGINAIAHAAEALYSRDASPVISLLAQQGIAALARALPHILLAPDDLEARSDALFGAWACGICLGSADMGLHHKLCHTLGGTFNLPHSEVHTVLLPYTLAYNEAAAPDAMCQIAAALGVQDAISGLIELNRRLGAPRALRDLGMLADGFDRAIEQATSAPYPNPEPITKTGIRSLLERAFDGRPPLRHLGIKEADHA